MFRLTFSSSKHRLLVQIFGALISLPFSAKLFCLRKPFEMLRCVTVSTDDNCRLVARSYKSSTSNISFFNFLLSLLKRSRSAASEKNLQNKIIFTFYERFSPTHVWSAELWLVEWSCFRALLRFFRHHLNLYCTALDAFSCLVVRLSYMRFRIFRERRKTHFFSSSSFIPKAARKTLSSRRALQSGRWTLLHDTFHLARPNQRACLYAVK